MFQIYLIRNVFFYQMIASYNKQLGKTLKSELEEKDKTIVKLRSNVEQLNGVQIENAKEKLTLCNELSALCHMKEKLNHELSWEVQKNFALDGAKKEIAEAAQNQVSVVFLSGQKNILRLLQGNLGNIRKYFFILNCSFINTKNFIRKRK